MIRMSFPIDTYNPILPLYKKCRPGCPCHLWHQASKSALLGDPRSEFRAVACDVASTGPKGPPSRESTAPHVATLLREGGGEISRTIRFLDRCGTSTRNFAKFKHFSARISGPLAMTHRKPAGWHLCPAGYPRAPDCRRLPRPVSESWRGVSFFQSRQR
jgi:hypothetical protein